MYNFGNPFAEPSRPGTGDYNRRRRNQNSQPNNNNDSPSNRRNEGFIEFDAEPFQETKTMTTNNGNATWTKPADGAFEYLNNRDERQNQLNNHQLDNEVEHHRLTNEDNNNQRNHDVAIAYQNNVPKLIDTRVALYEQAHRHKLEDRQQKIDAGYHYDATAAQMADREFFRDLALEKLHIDLDNIEYRDTGISDFFIEKLPTKTYETAVIAYGVQNIQYEGHEVIVTFVDDIRDGTKFSLGKGWFARIIGSLYYRGVYLIRFGKDPTVRKLGKLKRSLIPRNCCEELKERCWFQ